MDGVLRVDRRTDGRVGGWTISMGPFVGEKTGTGRAGEGAVSLVVDTGLTEQDKGCGEVSSVIVSVLTTSGIDVVVSSPTVFAADFDGSRISTISFVSTCVVC